MPHKGKFFLLFLLYATIKQPLFPEDSLNESITFKRIVQDININKEGSKRLFFHTFPLEFIPTPVYLRPSYTYKNGSMARGFLSIEATQANKTEEFSLTETKEDRMWIIEESGLPRGIFRVEIVHHGIVDSFLTWPKIIPLLLALQDPQGELQNAFRIYVQEQSSFEWIPYFKIIPLWGNPGATLFSFWGKTNQNNPQEVISFFFWFKDQLGQLSLTHFDPSKYIYLWDNYYEKSLRDTEVVYSLFALKPINQGPIGGFKIWKQDPLELRFYTAETKKWNHRMFHP